MAVTQDDAARYRDAGHDDAQHRQVQDLARLLDSQFRIPGTQRRFGVDGILGLVPGIGDAAGLALSAAVIVQAIGLGARGATVGKMVGNVAVDAVFGSIPVLGWVFDFVFKANNRNVALLERHVSDPAGTEQHSRASIRRTVIGAVIGLVVVLVALFALIAWVLTLVF